MDHNKKQYGVGLKDCHINSGLAEKGISGDGDDDLLKLMTIYSFWSWKTNKHQCGGTGKFAIWRASRICSRLPEKGISGDGDDLLSRKTIYGFWIFFRMLGMHDLTLLMVAAVAQKKIELLSVTTNLFTVKSW